MGKLFQNVLEASVTYSRIVLILRPLQLTTNLTVIWISSLHARQKKITTIPIKFQTCEEKKLNR